MAQFFKKILSGIHVEHRKNTMDMASEQMPTPDKLYISMAQHMGPPCNALVKVGDEVKVGQKIGDSEAFLTAPIHASVSGKVVGIEEINTAMGIKATVVVIESDKLQTLSEEVAVPVITNHQEFVSAIKNSGIVGLGGAGFPTHIKFNPKNLAEVKTLVVNAAECEPYITSDYRTMIEDAQNLLDGIGAIKKYMNLEQVLIGIEDNKPQAIAHLKKMVDKDSSIEIITLKSQYPQGGEKVLIYETTGKVVQEGKLPADIGIVVCNVTTCAFIGQYLKDGIPLIKKCLSIDGGAVGQAKNVIAPIGTKYSDLFAFCGGLKSTPAKVIMGGPMMGITIYDMDSPVMKNNNAILALEKSDVQETQPSPCIRCARCVNHCPFDLMPVEMEKAAMAEDVERLKELKTMSCMECGCCSFICPAKRHLTMSIKLGKQILRNNANKN